MVDLHSPAVKWLLPPQRALGAPFRREFTHMDTEDQLQVSLCLFPMEKIVLSIKVCQN